MKHPDTCIQAVLDRLVSPRLAVIDLSLDRINTLLATLGNPQNNLPPVVHVAGTNGKGSLLAYLTAILQAAGYKVHRYISPHLVRFNERMVLAGREIDDGRLLSLLERVEVATERHPVTFFEATTAAAFLAFAETPADVVLLETGLGGRLDATNTVRTPLLTAITPISIDHAEYLGNTLTSIAAEKAGILKPHVPCVTGPQLPEAAEVIEQAAHSLGAPLLRFGQEWSVEARQAGGLYRSETSEMIFPLPSLAGEHQLANAGAAIACCGHLKEFAVTPEHIREGIAHAVWPARLQPLTTGALASLLPPGAELWLDGGHNPGAGEILGRWLCAQKQPVHVICGMIKGKDTTQFLAPLAPCVHSLTAVAIEDEPLGQPVEAIAAAATAAGIADAAIHQAGNVRDAIERIVKDRESKFLILICGSLYLAGNILWQNSRVS